MKPVLEVQPSNIYEQHANNIKKYAKTGDSVFIVAQDTVGDYQFYTKYYLDGITTNLKYFNSEIEDNNIENNYEKNLKSYLKNFDYVYLAKLNDDYVDRYSYLYNNNIHENQMYKIVYKKGNLQLKFVSE